VSSPKLRRDDQQWVFDLMIQETGKVMHYQGDGRGGLPRSVRSHDMISKHLGRAARRMELLADEERAAGHATTALGRYFDAATTYANAQHVIFETSDEKRHLHGSSLRCFDAVRDLSPYPIERVEVPWEGSALVGNLHLCPGDEPRPLVFFVPGCDMTKEQYPHPMMNHALQRGLHLFSFDGPGQGEANIRGLHLAADNYERAVSAAIDELVARPEIDGGRVVLYGISYGSHWAIRIAAHESRIVATAAPWSSFCELYHLFDEESPRFKQLFMYMTGAGSEEELDRIAEAMSLRGLFERIEQPLLAACGEYDPRSPIEEVYEAFDRVTAPAELWVFEDQHHRVSLTKPGGHILPWLMDVHELALDWLVDRLAGLPLPEPHRVACVPLNGGGPGSVESGRRRWYEPL
jgi:dipeptidyl aminopeptidase/acylaminoacyl peptidase